MANVGEMRVAVGIDFEPFEWKVLLVLGGLELQKTLNEYSAAGWDIFAVLPGFQVILRKQIETPETSEESDD